MFPIDTNMAWLNRLIGSQPSPHNSGADPGFQVRGGALKKIAPSGGGAKIFGVFRVKNYDFTPKNYIFSNCGGRRENFWG
jgi:hypothetical protein